MKIAVLKGDGIGPEITEAAIEVLKAVGEKRGLTFTFEEGLFGGAAIDAEGHPYPESTQALAKSADAILLGAVGGPKWDAIERSKRPEAGLLALRKDLGLYCNIRPVKVRDFMVDQLALKEEVVKDVDFLICRELTSGIYFGPKERDGDEARDIMYYHKDEILRIVRDAFAMAQNRPRKKLTSVDKANVLETSRLWREVVEEVAQDYPDVTVDHLYVDNAAVQMILDPRQFDVLVTENTFGDILSDEAGALSGSLGMLPSASLGGTVSLYEPSHGSAPEIAGQDKANPIGTILSAAMLLRYSAKDEEGARMIEGAVDAVLAKDMKTADIADDDSQVLSCSEMTQAIISAL